MDVTNNDEAVLYVTLVQAAEEVGGSPEDLRAAVRRKRIRAVKENPRNKRSRWLVALEDVRNLNQADGQDTSEAPSNTREHPEQVTAREAMASGDNHSAHLETAASDQQAPETPEPTPDTHHTPPEDETPEPTHLKTEPSDEQEPQTPEPTPDTHHTPPEDETPEPTHLKTEPSDEQEPQMLNPTPDTHHTPPEDETPEPIDHHLPHFPSRGQMETPPAIIGAAPGRGEELVERLIEAIDRFSSTAPEAPFDYQALLDNYVVAVEQRSQAEVRAATLQRRLDDAHEQTADYSVRLEQAHAQNRQLLSELEIVKAELEAARDRHEGDEARPMWKRRNRQ